MIAGTITGKEVRRKTIRSERPSHWIGCLRDRFQLCCLPVLILLYGCAAPIRTTAQERMAREKSAELLSAVQKDDRTAFCAVLTPEYAAKFTPERFGAMRENLQRQFGVMKRFVFLDELAVPPFRNCVFKVTFQPRKGKGNAVPPEREALFRTLCGTMDGRDVVLGFGFF